jgi:hypothetical protein
MELQSVELQSKVCHSETLLMFIITFLNLLRFLSKYLNGKGGVDLLSGLHYIRAYRKSNGCGLWNSLMSNLYLLRLYHI